MMKSIVALFFLVFGAAAFSAPSTGYQATASVDTLKMMLWWLPENTETVVVTRDPFKLSRIDPDSPSVELRQYFQYEPMGYLPPKKEKFYDQFLGQTVLLAIDGSRHFRAPKNLGSMLYEGCQIIQFQEGFDASKEALVKLLKADAKEVREIAGQQVFVFEERLENDLWHFYIALPQKNLYLCATDEKFLQETLSRMQKKAVKRALPEQLPEWNYVNMQAPFWGLRHFERLNVLHDPSSPFAGKGIQFNAPDQQAIGLAYTYDPNQDKDIKLHYLTGNNAMSNQLQKYWSPSDYELKPTIRSLHPGVFEIALTPNGIEQTSTFLLLFFGAFGHGVYI
jgi:hypothetical protein